MQNNDENKTHDVAVDSDDEDQSREKSTTDRDDEVSSPGTDLSTVDCDDESSHTKKPISNNNDENPGCGTKKPVAKNESYAWPMYRASTSREKLLATPEDDYGCEHYKRKSKFVVCRQKRVKVEIKLSHYSVI